MDTIDVLTLGGLAVGVISLAVAVVAAVVAAIDARELKRLGILTLSALEEAKLVELARGKKGKIIGIKVYAKGSGSGEATGRAHATVRPPPGEG